MTDGIDSLLVLTILGALSFVTLWFFGMWPKKKDIDEEEEEIAGEAMELRRLVAEAAVEEEGFGKGEAVPRDAVLRILRRHLVDSFDIKTPRLAARAMRACCVLAVFAASIDARRRSVSALKAVVPLALRIVEKCPEEKAPLWEAVRFVMFDIYGKAAHGEHPFEAVAGRRAVS